METRFIKIHKFISPAPPTDVSNVVTPFFHHQSSKFWECNTPRTAKVEGPTLKKMEDINEIVLKGQTTSQNMDFKVEQNRKDHPAQINSRNPIFLSLLMSYFEVFY